jgi:2-C-methyl-D-erythritol 2,4-cyclodiphosphate synthase
MLQKRGWRTGNCDITIVCEQPRIGPHLNEMRAAIAAALGVPREACSVKATTTEKLGFCGRGEGIAALAIAQIEAVE